MADSAVSLLQTKRFSSAEDVSKYLMSFEKFLELRRRVHQLVSTTDDSDVVMERDVERK